MKRMKIRKSNAIISKRDSLFTDVIKYPFLKLSRFRGGALKKIFLLALVLTGLKFIFDSRVTDQQTVNTNLPGLAQNGIFPSTSQLDPATAHVGPQDPALHAAVQAGAQDSALQPAVQEDAHNLVLQVSALSDPNNPALQPAVPADAPNLASHVLALSDPQNPALHSSIQAGLQNPAPRVAANSSALGSILHSAAAPYVINPIKKIKNILLWNDHFGKKDFGIGKGNLYFYKRHCKYKKCNIILRDENSLPMSEIDAVVFHPVSKDKTLPKERHPHTRYVFFFLETPVMFNKLDGKTKIEQYNGVFNYTMTYRRDSDVFISNGDIAKKRRRKHKLRGLDKIMLTKKKLVAWFVSNCNTNSKRSRITKSLQKVIPVDVFGACGPFKCKKTEKKQCLAKLEQEYKFHLSFENAICQDYITEKFYYYATSYIVPVLYGGADYRGILPPKSYIDVRDFDNTTHLASYLQYLDKNDTAYMEYFDWKLRYEVVSTYGTGWCDLCAKLHLDTEPKVYHDFKSWYATDKCIEPDSFLSKFAV